MSPEAKLFLKEIQGRPEFHEVLDELRIKKPPLFKPVRQNDSNILDPVLQVQNWQFDSGAFAENTRILDKLSGVKND
jgi:hypothetical protein